MVSDPSGAEARSTRRSTMPATRLLIGPVLRRVVGTRATVWVETSAPAVVTVRRGRRRRGHRADLLRVRPPLRARGGGGAGPGQRGASYEVLIDDEMVWPVPETAYPPSVIRTRAGRRPRPAGEPDLRLVPGDHPARHHPAAPPGRARRVRPAADRPTPERVARPDLLVLLGDQVYADVTSPKVKRLAQAAPAAAGERPGRPGGQLRRVHQALPGVLARPGDPLAALHRAERDDLRRPRDHRRLEHLGGLARGHARAALVGRADPPAAWPPTGSTSTWATSPRTRSPADPLYAKVVAAEDATDVLREFGERVDAEADVAHDTERWRAVQYQWSYALDLGRTRLVMLDNRCSRVLEPGARAMLPPGEWGWFLDQAHGDYDHLVVGSSLPWLLPPGIHHLEAWNERARRLAPALGGRRSPRRYAGPVDLEHWAAFQRSFDALAALFARIGRARRARRPGRRRARVRAAGLDQRALRGRAPLVRRPGSPVRPSGPPFDDRQGAHAGAPAHLLADPQPGAGALRQLMSSAGTPGWPRPPGPSRAPPGCAGPRLEKLAGPYFGNAVAPGTRGRGAD